MIKLIIFSCLFISLFHQGLSFNQENVGQQLTPLRLKRSNADAISGASSSASAGSSSGELTNPMKFLGNTLEDVSKLVDKEAAEAAVKMAIDKLQGLVKQIDEKTKQAMESLMKSEISPVKTIKQMVANAPVMAQAMSKQVASALASATSKADSSSSIDQSKQ